MRALRSPYVAFGRGNRWDQALELICELSPITVSRLSSAKMLGNLEEPVLTTS